MWASAGLSVNTALVRSRGQGKNDGEKSPEAGYLKKVLHCSHHLGDYERFRGSARWKFRRAVVCQRCDVPERCIP